MKPTLVDAITSLFMIQRWNFLPRVETWVEAENVAYSAHIGFALLCDTIDKPLEFKKLAFDYLAYEILKPLTKHFLSDVSYRFKNALNESIKDPKQKWNRKVEERALADTRSLFPRMIRPQVAEYLVESRDIRIIELCKYVQRNTALQECEKNSTVYREYYEGYIKEIKGSINQFCKESSWMKKLDKAFKRYNKRVTKGDADVIKLPGYLKVIRNLKYLRRWNRINRSIETNVLSHTYVVTLLTLLFTWMHEESKKLDQDFKIQTLQRALFHDVPEALTGDIITPVKDIIKREYPKEKNLWADLENKLAVTPIKILTGTSSNLSKYIDKNHLLDDVSDHEKNSAASLVKDCDRMALVIECIQEGFGAKIPLEMSRVYPDYLEELQNSEWPYIREFAAKLATRYHLVSLTD
jgi:putative hydrolases of HD superfamily